MFFTFFEATFCRWAAIMEAIIEVLKRLTGNDGVSDPIPSVAQVVRVSIQKDHSWSKQTEFSFTSSSSSQHNNIFFTPGVLAGKQSLSSRAICRARGQPRVHLH